MTEAVKELLKPLTGPNGPAGGAAEDQISALEEIVQGTRTEKIIDGKPQETVQEPSWSAVRDKAASVLKKDSKHLRAGMVYCVGATQTLGWPGLSDGLELLAGLLEGFGDKLHPVAADGDLFERIAILNDLALPISKPRDPYNFVFRVLQLKLTRSTKHGSWSFLEMEASRSPESNLLPGANPPTPQDVAASWSDLKDEQQELILGSLTNALAALARITEVFKGKKGQPNIAFLRETLEKIQRRTAAKGQSEPPSVPGGPIPGPTLGAGPGPGGSGPLQTRKQALTRLAEVRDYFKGAEPSSPIYLLTKLALEVSDKNFIKIIKRLDSTGVDNLEKYFGTWEKDEDEEKDKNDEEKK